MRYCTIISLRGQWGGKFKTLGFKGRQGIRLEQTCFRDWHYRPWVPTLQGIRCPRGLTRGQTRPALQPPRGGRWRTDHLPRGRHPWAPCRSPKGENHSLALGLRAQAAGEVQLHEVVNKSPNFPKSRFSRLPNVGPRLAGHREDRTCWAQVPTQSSRWPVTLTSPGAVSWESDNKEPSGWDCVSWAGGQRPALTATSRGAGTECSRGASWV